jgi:hypothetical protein
VANLQCHAGNSGSGIYGSKPEQLCCAKQSIAMLRPVFDRNLCEYSLNDVEHSAAAALSTACYEMHLTKGPVVTTKC